MPPYLRLLGRPRVETGTDTVEPPFGKAWGLLLVLATRGTWVDRAELVYLFWPDQDESRARTNLRKLLSRNVAALPFAGGLEAEPSRLRWLVGSDVAEFRASLAEGRLAHALGLYGGPFLDGIRADGVPEFEAWLEGERETMARAWREAGTTLANQAAGEGRVDDAARVLRSLVEADPFDEDAVGAYMEALAAAGRTAAALDAYRAFAERLGREFGESPSRATEALAEGLRELAAAPASLTPSAPRPSAHAAAPEGAEPGAARALPRPATPLVGRMAERQRLTEQIRDPECRLLTVTAPGGFGKTRLALAAAGDLQDAFPDGVTFVPLAAVADPEGVPFAIAEALGLAITGARPAFDQVAEHLRPREALLVLDNLEQLGDDALWLARLLEAAPALRVLATSRAPLDLALEWRFELRGLGLAPTGEDPSSGDAVQLFLQTARREHEASASAAPIELVDRLCRLLDGMPLALELAAGWLSTLGIEELLRELDHDTSLLTTTRPDVPERHRSVQAVFDASIDRLPPEAREAFEALGAFPGSFDRSAAAAVAGATPQALRDMASRSLLASSGDGRYRLHELLRHAARERLARDPERERRILDLHARHYDEWLVVADRSLHGRSPAATLAQLDLERDNVTAALRRSVATRDHAAALRIADALETYFVQRTRYAAGAALYEEAAEALGTDDAEATRTTAGLLVWAGWLEFRRGRFDHARELAARAHRLFDEGSGPRARIECEGLLGALEGTRGAYEEAWEHFDRALALARRARLPEQVAMALNNLAIAEKQLGLFRQAEATYREALAINRSLGRSLNVARTLNNLGLLLLADGRGDEATSVLDEALALARDIDAQQVVPNVLGGLAQAAAASGDAATARATAEEAWRLISASGARGRVSPVLVTLALAAATEGDHEEADRALAAALADARETLGRSAVLVVLAGAGRVRSLRGDHRDAVMALSLIRDEPGLEHSVRAELGPAWRRSVGELGDDAAEARREAERLGVDGLLARLVPSVGGPAPPDGAVYSSDATAAHRRAR